MRNTLLRASALAAVGLVMAPQSPAAAIRINCQQSGSNGKKTLSPEIVLDPEPGIIPDSIVAILSANARIVDSIPSGLAITRSTLTPAQAYGAGLPGGFVAAPPNNPTGPWVGLNWPFRDFNDGYAPSIPPAQPGNNVGVIDVSGAATGQYSISEMIGQQALALPAGTSFRRGSPGDGATDYIRFFSFDVDPTVLIEREVSVIFEGVQVLGRVRNDAGMLETRTFDVPNITVRFLVPAPATGMLGAIAVVMTARRRRR